LGQHGPAQAAAPKTGGQVALHLSKFFSAIIFKREQGQLPGDSILYLLERY
jgi:hypothetical protein